MISTNRRIKAAGVALSVVVVAALVAGCGGSNSKSSSGGASAPSTHINMQVLNGKMATARGYIAPDKLGHDTMMVTNLSSAQAHDPNVRSNLNVKAGQKVTVTVTNYDEGSHTFTVPDVGINKKVAPAKNAAKGIPSKTTFTFTVKKSGKFRWYCADPCDKGQGGWAMMADKSGPAKVGYMAGYVIAS